MIAIATAAAAGIACTLMLPHLAVELSAVVFFFLYLVLMMLRLPHLTADYLHGSAEEADEPAPVILLVTLSAVGVSVTSLFIALNDGGRVGLAELLFAFASVVGGWFAIHMMAAMHYAHLFWRPDGDKAKGRHHGGLDFPATPSPCGWDFVYFAYVIGMTAQTSDTAVTTTAMRRLNLLHAIVSYFFNTVLIAAAVNGAVQLAG
ncbi:DUF1345 domain-containing protein [Ciceribacter sp. L1K22]|uniref:DUF1345 domain-containing protein n=1 Tax=Ciceribacter sp. L1K22 TaxID=2820275 RepID=UPI001ABEB691|nr:DUF1345 domain-containing protein [Ciceribacter sp. L1K22]MBO3760504.1 DUF1345 domain-containing protein [Ciceribacter sp. L1K22]